MRIILSRKGFDTANGNCASPIMPDGTALSMPIPSKKASNCRYDEIRYKNETYLDIWKQLKPRRKDFPEYCHLDPDLRKYARNNPDNWFAAFGQTSGSQTHLEQQGVMPGDLFIFFGWFKETERKDGILRFKKDARDEHVLFGYLQIGDILKGDNVKLAPWHPHSSDIYLAKTNAIYTAAETLSFDGEPTELAGYGTLKYSHETILTKPGHSRSQWQLPDFFQETRITHHSAASFKDGYFQSAKIGQEFVIEESPEVTAWAKQLITNNAER